MTLLQKAWDEILRPMIKRPNRFQVAALCYRTRNDKKEVLLITSRGTGRWILPKGWPMEGKSASEAAAIEAWEEAGVKPAQVSNVAIGDFDYIKDRDDGVPIPCDTQVYPIEVATLADTFPEAGTRQRKWMSTDKAADLVEEEGLAALLRAF
ncbi:MAG: NUDIX hydrolase [Maritimibacter sp.]